MMMATLFGYRSREGSAKKEKEEVESQNYMCTKLVEAGFSHAPIPPCSSDSSHGISSIPRIPTRSANPKTSALASLQEILAATITSPGKKKSGIGNFRRKPKSVATTFIAAYTPVGPVCISLKAMDDNNKNVVALVRTRYAFHLHSFLQEQIEEKSAAVAALQQYFRLPHVISELHNDAVLEVSPGNRFELDTVDAMAFEIVDNAKQLERKPDLEAALTVLDCMNIDAMDHVVVDVIIPDAEADLVKQIPFNVGVTAEKLIPPSEDSRIYRDLGLIFKSAPPRKDIVSPPQIANPTIAKNAIHEIYEVEKQYLQKLKQYQKDYVDHVDTGSKHTSSDEYYKQCFVSVKNLIVASEELLGKLRTPQASVEHFCTVFVEAADENKPFFKAYKEYQNAYETASHKIQTAKEKKMTRFLNNLEALGTDPEQSFDTLRALPIQRFPRYVMALQNITQNTHPSDPQYQLTVKAHGDMHLATLRLDEGQKMKHELVLLANLDERLGAAGQLVKSNMFYICELHCSVIDDKHYHIGDVTLILYNRQLAIVERKANNQKWLPMSRKKGGDLSGSPWRYRVSTIHVTGTITAVDLPEHDFRLVTLPSQVADSMPPTSEDTLNFNSPLNAHEGIEKRVVTYRAESKESKDLFLRAFRDTEVKMTVLRKEFPKENVPRDIFSPTNLYVDQHNNIDIYFNIIHASDALERSSGRIGLGVVDQNASVSGLLEIAKIKHAAFGLVQSKDDKAQVTFGLQSDVLGNKAIGLIPAEKSEWAAPGDVKRSILETVCSLGTIVQQHQPDMTRFKLVTETCLQAICDNFQKVRNTSVMNSRNISRSSSIHSLLSVASHSSASSIQSENSANAKLPSRKNSLLRKVSNVFGNQPQQDVEPVYPSRSTPEPMNIFPPSRIPRNPMRTYGADRTLPIKARGPQGPQTQSLRGSPTKRQPTRGQSSGTSAKFTKDVALDALIKAIESTGLNRDLGDLYRIGDKKEIDYVVDVMDKFAKQSVNRISTLNQTYSPAVLSVALKKTLLNWCDKVDSEKDFLSSREARQNINAIFKHTDQEPEKLAESLKLSLEETLDSEQKKRMALLFHHWNRVWQAIQTEGVDNNLGFNLACFVKIRYESKVLDQTHISLANFLCEHAHKVFPITSATKRKVSQGAKILTTSRPQAPKRADSTTFEKTEKATSPSRTANTLHRPIDQPLLQKESALFSMAGEKGTVIAKTAILRLTASTPSSLPISTAKAKKLPPAQSLPTIPNDASATSPDNKNASIPYAIPATIPDAILHARMTTFSIPALALEVERVQLAPPIALHELVPKPAQSMTSPPEPSENFITALSTPISEHLRGSTTNLSKAFEGFPFSTVMLQAKYLSSPPDMSQPANSSTATHLWEISDDGKGSVVLPGIRRSSSMPDESTCESMSLARVALANEGLRQALSSLSMQKLNLQHDLSSAALQQDDSHDSSNHFASELDTLPDESSPLTEAKRQLESIADEFKSEMAAFVQAGDMSDDGPVLPKHALVASRSQTDLAGPEVNFKPSRMQIDALIEENKRLHSEHISFLQAIQELEQRKRTSLVHRQSHITNIALPAEN